MTSALDLYKLGCLDSGESGIRTLIQAGSPLATQNRIFDAYLAAFPTTLLMQRYPSVGGTSERPRLGLFDDSFCIFDIV